MMTKPYHVEGIHIWGTPMQNWYDQKKLKESISSPELSEYLRPFEAHADSEVIDGPEMEHGPLSASYADLSDDADGSRRSDSGRLSHLPEPLLADRAQYAGNEMTE